MENTNKISKMDITDKVFEEALTNNIPDKLKEIEEEIELKKKKLKLAKLDKAIFKNHIIKINGAPYFGRDLSYGATKIADIENEIGKNPPPTPRRDTNYYKNKFERKKHSYNLEDVLMIVFLSIFGSVMITLIIIGR